MENPTGAICDTDYKSLINQCLEICSALKDKGCKFSLSLRLGSSFNFSLSSEGCSPEATKKTRRSPSYLRRQTRRRAAFLERKKKLPLADVVTPTTHNNQACRQGGATLLDKKTASSWQTAVSEVEIVVDNDCSLDLNPNPTHPREPDDSLESVDSGEETKVKFLLAEECTHATIEAEYRKWEADRRHLMPGYLSIDDKFRLGYMEHYAKQGSNCETCQQTIDDKKRRYYPHLCERCGSYLEKVNIAPSVTTSLSKAAY